MMLALRTAAALLCAALATVSPPAASGVQAVAETASPAGPGSLAPNLHADADGRIHLSWIEVGPDRTQHLKFSTWEGRAWSPAREIARGRDWFVNWADFPSVVALPKNGLAAHWLRKNGPDTFHYEVKLARSSDGGASWGASITPHRDGTQSEHGFVSLVPWGDSRVGAVWLDGRKFVEAKATKREALEEMTLRFAAVGPDGSIGEEALLDGRVCDCCQTSAAITSDGALVAYRDRSESEVRDISIVRYANGRWSEPRTLHPDGWEIPGCPVNGPSVAADGRRVAVAWFTNARNTARVKVAFSADAGASFGEPLQVDGGAPIGRVDTAMLDDGSALVSWLERTPAGGEIRIRRVFPNRGLGRELVVARTTTDRAGGFPAIARSRDLVVVAWTQAGTPSQVRTATLKVSDFASTP